MDILTLNFCTGLLSLGMGLTLSLHLFTSHNDKYLIDWIVAAACFFASNSFGFYMLYENASHPMLVSIANCFYVAGHAAVISGIYRLLNNTSISKVILGVFAVTLALHQLPIFVDSLSNRFLAIYPFIVVMLVYGIIALFKHRNLKEAKAFNLLMVTMGIFLIQLVARYLCTLLEKFQLETQGSEFMHSSGSMFLILYLFMLTISCSSIVMYKKLVVLRELAFTDELTGWLNRKSLSTIASAEVQRSLRSGNPLTFIMIDIDHFKQVNDKYGHAAGDSALEKVSAIAKKLKREQDYHFRIGGEEFLIIASETNLLEANAFAERIRDSISSTPLQVGLKQISLTVSIGLAQLQHGEARWQDVLNRADNALFASKSAGRNKVSTGPNALPQTS